MVNHRRQRLQTDIACTDARMPVLMTAANVQAVVQMHRLQTLQADNFIELRQYATTQYLVIDTLFVPDAWADAVAQAQPGQIAPGTTAVTIEGTRHRDGLWNGEPVSSEHAVSFTVFIVCAPTYPTCHLLRLSQLDNPLR